MNNILKLHEAIAVVLLSEPRRTASIEHIAQNGKPEKVIHPCRPKTRSSVSSNDARKTQQRPVCTHVDVQPKRNCYFNQVGMMISRAELQSFQGSGEQTGNRPIGQVVSLLR